MRNQESSVFVTTEALVETGLSKTALNKDVKEQF